MRFRVSHCLLFLLLGCKCTAELNHKQVAVEEKQPVTLPCPHSVEGNVTWSRDINGGKVDLITAAGDRHYTHRDPDGRYGSLGDKSLHISGAAVSDSGRYFCNNQTAAELTVIPSAVTTANTTTAVTAAAVGATALSPSAPQKTASCSWQTSVRTAILALYLLILTSITVVTCRKAEKRKRSDRTEPDHL